MAKEKAMDGAYVDLVTGLGTSADKDTHVSVDRAVRRPDYASLGAQYVKDGIVRRIARMPPVKALKEPISINDDPDGDTFRTLDGLRFFEAVTEAGAQSRLVGGAVVVTIYDDRAKLSEPVGKGAKVAGYRVFSAARVLLDAADFVDDLRSPFYGDVELFPIALRDGRIERVHASRCAVFHGNRVPDAVDTDWTTGYFGTSEVDLVNDALKKIAPVMGGLSNMMQDNGVAVFGIDGLAQILAAPDGLSKMTRRAAAVKMGMSSMHAVFQDKNDQFQMLSHSFAGMEGIVKLFFAYVSASCGIPVSILFGNMVSGLSTTNEGDIEQFRDMTEQWRADTLYRPMCAMLTDFRNRNEGRPGSHDFQWGAVSAISARERAEIMHTNAETANTLFQLGAFTAREIRENMLVNGGALDFSVRSAKIPRDGGR